MIEFRQGKAIWGDYPSFSDWRGYPPPDISTNVPVSNYYTGRTNWLLRREDASKMRDRLRGGDTLLIGADYYALSPLSQQFIPAQLLLEDYDYFMAGGVRYYRCWMGDSVTVLYQRMKLDRRIQNP